MNVDRIMEQVEELPLDQMPKLVRQLIGMLSREDLDEMVSGLDDELFEELEEAVHRSRRDNRNDND